MARILVAEDGPHILKLIEHTLNQRQHQCISCTSGEKAKELIGLEPPDLAILDVMLPGLDGLSLLKELKDESATTRIPVIILTSLGRSNTRDQANLSGVDCFMTKPFSPTKLLDTIDQLLEQAP